MSGDKQEIQYTMTEEEMDKVQHLIEITNQTVDLEFKERLNRNNPFVKERPIPSHRRFPDIDNEITQVLGKSKDVKDILPTKTETHKDAKYDPKMFKKKRKCPEFLDSCGFLFPCLKPKDKP
jgi:hypothetical protein